MPYVCTVCNDGLPYDFVTCVSKGCKLHFGPCSGIQEASWRKTDKTKWKCLACRKDKQTPPEDNKPVSGDELREFMNMINQKLKPIEQISEMNDTIKELKKSVDFMSEQYDGVVTRLEELEEQKNVQKTQLQNLQSMVEERDALISNLQERIRENEQYARNRNIEISGLEEVKGEDLKEIMKNIAQKIKVDYNEDDIDVIHRIPTKRSNEHPKVIAQFTTRRTRNQWLKCKKNALVASSEVTGGQAFSTVYLNTHLTPEWKHLLWAAKQYGRPKGYKIIWFQDNKINAKKDVTDRPVFIKSEKDFEKMK
ncbi:Sulfide:quinone oxidoreductase, mitochondrial [Frankliniella fusca]|uniref:Sulfide:quinone oxidoreductase, mitochondrial n=1 Tax=Frankliniella fusca TaxID=407009 RepID=A0AAE1LPG0_9NEOP|nr:Sulfide:quinone oxidoreductase, mitochondrial [Frankliniella fusca]